jgi:Rieske Fe-S protein
MGCSRREFLKIINASLGAGAVAVALPACGGGGGVDGSVTVLNGQAVLPFSQFPALMSAGGGVVVSASGTPVAVIRTGATTVAALSGVCTHAGCTVNYNGNSDLYCGCHGSMFSSTGAVLVGPARSPLQRFTATLNAADVTVSGL